MVLLPQVLNGVAVTAPNIERLCGTVPTGYQVKSSANTMTVVFRTDSSVSNGGFTATYSSNEDACEYSFTLLFLATFPRMLV